MPNKTRHHAPDPARGPAPPAARPWPITRAATPPSARRALPLTLAACALLTGCFGGLSGGPAMSLTREDAPKATAVDLRAGLAAGENHGPGATLGGHIRTKFSNEYSEVAFGLDGSVLGIYDIVAFEARVGASLAPFALRRDTIGLSPIGSFAQATLFLCSDQCFSERDRESQVMLSLSASVDARLLILGSSLDLGQEAFLTPMIGLTFFDPIRIW